MKKVQLKGQEGIIMIHGTPYKTVAKRVEEFRAQYRIDDGWSIETAREDGREDPNVIVFVARIVDPAGKVVAVGHAEERRDANKINRTSALEVCETSAIGRALASAGYAGSEYASADEVINAIAQQQRPTRAPVVQKPLQGTIKVTKERNYKTDPVLTQQDQDRRRIVITELLEDINISYALAEAYCQSQGLPMPCELEGQRAHRMIDYFKSEQGQKAITEFSKEY